MPDPVRRVGTVADAQGYQVTFGVDRGSVTIEGIVPPLVLGRAERDLFARVFMQAENEAEAWEREHGEAPDAG